jgi:hypothetical protein
VKIDYTTTEGGWNPTTEGGQHATSEDDCKDDDMHQSNLPACSTDHPKDPPPPDKKKYAHANRHGGRPISNVHSPVARTGVRTHSKETSRAHTCTPNADDRGEPHHQPVQTRPRKQNTQQDETGEWPTNWQQAQQQRHRIPQAHRVFNQDAN